MVDIMIRGSGDNEVSPDKNWLRIRVHLEEKKILYDETRYLCMNGRLGLREGKLHFQAQ